MANIDNAYGALAKQFEEFKENYDGLMKRGDVSFASSYQEQFSKSLLLSCASYFESVVVELVKKVLRLDECELRRNFVSQKALNRNYHSLFNWGANNATSFFSLFGSGFNDFIKKNYADNDEFCNSVKSFLEIGNQRNKLVHNNFIIAQMDDDANAIFEKFMLAKSFVEQLDSLFSEYQASLR